MNQKELNKVNDILIIGNYYEYGLLKQNAKKIFSDNYYYELVKNQYLEKKEKGNGSFGI